MSQKEWDRFRVLQDVVAKKVSQKYAASLLGLSTRQVRTLQRRVESDGMHGVVSRKVGRPSNRRHPEALRQQIIEKAQAEFSGWGPTLIAEKLRETDGISVSSEYVRQVMIAHTLWHNRSRKIRQHLPRNRRACFGDMIQADGSHHHWFGQECPACCLTVLIDDATGKITSLYFTETETTEGYFIALRRHFDRYGIPRSLYSDRHALFGGVSLNRENSQLGRALHELGIESIFAHTPQAKGRVERVNRTLQDRLVKELALRGIKDLRAANAFLNAYVDSFNARFAKAPLDPYDAHRPTEGYDVGWILAHRETRSLDRNLIFQYQNEHYVVNHPLPRRLTGKKVLIKQNKDSLEVRYEGEVLPTSKLSLSMESSPKYCYTSHSPRHHTPKSSHPYKRPLNLKIMREEMINATWRYN